MKFFYLMDETKSGIGIAYDVTHSCMHASPICCRSIDMRADYRMRTVACQKCRKEYSNSIITGAVRYWSTSWLISPEDATIKLSKWAAGWTGIDEERLEVSINP